MQKKSALDSIRDVTKIVVDSSDFKSFGKFNSIDATTNPSLLIKSISDAKYHSFIREEVKKYSNYDSSDIAREVVISFAEEILKIIPGRVSIEVDPSIAFDTKNTELEALKVIDSCNKRGIVPKRILIKIPATWEGIQAAKSLEKRNIKCNLTLLFSEIQALSCADAGVTMISPFVGRISDWWKMKGLKWQFASDDPGVKFVRSVFFYLKKKKYSTEVMAASFRSVDQIFSLAGLELLTISPDLLSNILKLPPKDHLTRWVEDFQNQHFKVFQEEEKNIVSHGRFLNSLSTNEMANDKLIDGVNIFKNDSQKLFKFVENEKKVLQY